ncbi:MAG: DUF3667 domain-containing protein [Allomuricauda sp.]
MAEDRYCRNCGAKVILKRLTLKNVWEDVGTQIFNLDNTFLKTLKGLFLHPQLVILSYLSGIRKRYMNPVSYFAIAVTLSGLMFFILRNVYHVNLTKSSFSDTETSDLNFMFDYQGLMSYLIMPLYAFMTWLVFSSKKKFNYTEHLVANAYIIGQTSYVQVVAYIIGLGLFPIQFDVFNFGFLLVMIIYQFYVLGKMHQTGFWSTLWRAFVYFLMLIIVMIGIGVIAIVIALITGKASLADFAPQS